MSVINVERKSRCVGEPDHTVELPTPIQEKLHTVVRQDRRAELLHRVAVAAAVGLLAIIGLILADVLFGLRWPLIRWAIWVGGLGITVGAVRYFVVKPWLRHEQLLDAAWKIESSHPAMEERLTSTVQFLEEDSDQHTSPQLIDALVTETSDGVGRIDAESIPTRSSRIPVTVAAALATTLVFSVALWPRSVLTSLDNLATPWSPYVVPTLSANIFPGDVTIAEGESVSIKVTAADALDHPMLEIIRGDAVESHLMVATSPEVSTFTLTDVSQDAVYRVHSGGLYSVPHTITVHPQPQLTAIAGRLDFPDYTRLDPLTIERVTEPIEVPSGTEVTLTAISDDVAARGVVRWKSEPHEVTARKAFGKGSADSVRFEWTFEVEPETELVGTLEVRSKHGVGSVPHPIAIRALDDSAPTIEITTPSLQQLTMRRDGDLPIRYQVIDDFGVSKAELIVMFEKQEPVARPCPDPEEQLGDPRAWIGATSLGLNDVAADCQEVSLWLRIADNRPDEFGGAQVIESEAIHITLDDRADSVGQQQILADRQMIEQSLGQAIEQMREAQAAAEALQNDRGETGGPNQQVEQDPTDPQTAQDHEPIQDPKRTDPKNDQALAANDPGPKADRSNFRADHIDTLRRQTLKAKRTLEQLAKELQGESNLFQPKAAEIQQVADQEVKKALELANQIPLADNQLQQNELARGSGQQLASAVDQLDQLKSDIEQQAEQMEQAAQLDQLASKQERLARKAAEGDQNGAPDEQWRDRQEVVADDLQNLVEENEEARGQQLLQRAEEAERLAEQAQLLAQQQRQLGAFMEQAQQDDRQAEKLNQKLKDLIADQRDEIEQQAQLAGQPQEGEANGIKDEADKKQQQRLDDAAKAVNEGDLDQAAANLQEQIAERAEQLQQQADQLAQQNIPDQPAKEQIEQAAGRLQQAKEKVDQAKQALDKEDGEDGQNDPQENRGEIKRDQQDAARSLDRAAESLNQACKSCRKAANQTGPNGLQNAAKQEGKQDHDKAEERQDDGQPRQDQQAGNKADEDDPKAADQPQIDPQDQEQLLEQADQAEQLAEQAQQLAQQQQQLEQAMREAQQNNRKAEEAKQQLQDLIEAQKNEINQQARQAAQRQAGDAKQADKDKEAERKQKQRMDEAAKAAQEGDLDQAAAKIQEQVAEQAEKIQQQAEQLAKEDNPEPIVQERAKQAAEQLQQAKQKADQAKKSLCEKCNGGGQNKSGEQNKLGGQNKPDGQNPKPDGQNPEPDGQNQGAKPQNQNPQQQPQGAGQPKDAGQQKQATKQGDAQINRDQQDAARSLQQASQTLNQVCKSCRECASCNKPGSSDGSKSGSSKSSGSRKGDLAKSGPAARAKQLAKASDGAKQAAKSPSKEKAAQNAKDVAEQLNQLADEAAQKSGYSLRQQKGSPKEQGKQQGNANKPGNNALSGQPGQPSGDPQGVGKAAGDTNLNGQKLRGGSNSNWTRSRRKLGGGVLDDREGNVPEQYRGVVKRYFEQLSRQQSSREE